MGGLFAKIKSGCNTKIKLYWNKSKWYLNRHCFYITGECSLDLKQKSIHAQDTLNRSILLLRF